MTWLLLTVAAWVFLSVPVAVVLGHHLRNYASPCTCRKHAWNPACPVHGTQDAA